MLFRETLIGWLFSCIGYGDCGGPFWLVAANVGGCRGSGTHQFLIAGLPSHGCCIHTPSSASPPDIQGKSRMRKRARTDLCGVVSRMREKRNAVPEMKEDPSEPAYRCRL